MKHTLIFEQDQSYGSLGFRIEGTSLSPDEYNMVAYHSLLLIVWLLAYTLYLTCTVSLPTRNSLAQWGLLMLASQFTLLAITITLALKGCSL